jgi:putative transposase
VGRRCKAKDVVAGLEELSSLYQASKYIGSDNRPEFIAQALRDWCEAIDTTRPAYIGPPEESQTNCAATDLSRC